MTGLCYPGDHPVSRHNIYGEPLNCREDLLFSDEVFLAFQGLFSGVIAGAIVREKTVVFCSGEQEGIAFLRSEFGLDV